MAILQQTKNKLKLRFLPWYCWIITVICSAIWLPDYLALFSEIVSAKTLNCQRVESRQINCEFKDLTLLPFKSSTVLIEDLQGAKVKRISDRNNKYEKQQVVLLTKQKEIYFYLKI